MGTIKWVLNNKEWLFSGVGIFVVIGIYNFFKNKYKSKVRLNADLKSDIIPAMPVEEKSDVNETTNRINLSPEYIQKEIEKLPPLQQDDALKHYTGLNITWEAALLSVKKENNGYVRVMVTIPGRIGSYITFSVRLSDYPVLAVIKEKTKIRVKGTISSIDIPYFRLKGVLLNIGE